MEKLPLVKIFKELGVFIGKKIDEARDDVKDAIRSTPQKIQVDMSDTSARIGELQTVLSKEIQTMSQTIEQCTVNNYRSVEAACANLCESIDRLEKEFTGKEFNITVPDMSPSILAMKASIDSLVEASSKDSSNAMISCMYDVMNSVESLKAFIPKIEPVDLTPVTMGIERMIGAVREKNNQALEDKIDTLIEAVRGIKLNAPGVVKLDEMQVRAMSNRSGGISTNGGNLAARNVTLSNLALTATNTQYTYTFPNNTVAWTIKLREQGVLGYYSFTTGTLPVVGGGGDASNYGTIPQNFLQSQTNVDWSGKKIYLGAESATQVAEITVYTL